MARFKQGDRVICIRGTEDKCIVTDGIYKVRGYSEKGGVMLYLTTNYSFHGTNKRWVGYKEDRFKPFDESFAEEVINKLNFKIVEK